jgi:glycosyltransferase involved in cell wall biosynthesis
VRIGYIASSIYRHTFEINEVAELHKLDASVRTYSFYRDRHGSVQHERIEELDFPVVTWSPAAFLPALLYILARHPLRTCSAALGLFFRSLRNPVYCYRNAMVFLIAMPILRDAHQNGVTHMHANFGSSPATIARLGKHIFGMSYSVMFHAFDIYVDRGPYQDPLRSIKLRDADRVFAAHADGLNALKRMVPREAHEKFEVVHISVRFHALPRTRPLPQPPLLLAAGNLVAQKGFDVLVRAAGLLARRGVNARVRILGEGEERSALEALAGSEGVVVEMPGYFQHRELARHMAEAAAFVMPSKIAHDGFRDGIPTVMVEAWLARTPVIASPVAGMGEVLAADHNALVFTPEKAGELADAVERLLRDPALGETIVSGGYETAVSSFSPETNVARLLSSIRSIR